MSKRVSLSDLARHTKLAVSTVSMALRDVGTLSLETRKTVQEAARKLGYYPNPLLAALASKRFSSEQRAGTPLIYLRPANDEFEWKNTTLELFNNASDRARRLGYSLDYMKISDFRDGVHATQVLLARGVQGIILRHPFKLKSLPGMDWSRFSVVEASGGMGEPTNFALPIFSTITVDYFGQVLRAWNETRDRGYQKIGVALFPLKEGLLDDYLRWSAVQLCLQGIPRDQRIPIFISKEPGKEFVSSPIKKWVQRYRPDVVIGFNDIFRWLLEEEGFRIPQGLGFVSLHTGTGVNLAGTKEMRQECLLGAVELLDQQIRHHQVGLMEKSRTVLIHSEWMEGETLPLRNPPEAKGQRLARGRTIRGGAGRRSRS